MRLVIQRVTQASVTVSGSVVGAINKGYLVLVGIGQNDTEAIVEKMADKMMRLRIFSDENDKIQPVPARRWRSTAAGFAIHIICRLPEGQQTIIYWCRSA